MANNSWRGIAPNVAQVDTLTLGGTWETDDKLVLTMTNLNDGTTEVLTVTSGSTTIATICTTLAAAINAINTAGTTTSLFYPVFASAGSTTVTVTARTAGVPFSLAVTTTENGGGAADSQTFTRAATTASSGASDWSTAANWATGSVPAGSDDVTINTGSTSLPILYGLNQSGVTLASLTHYKCGSAVGTTAYALKISATKWKCNVPPTDGSVQSGALFSLNTGTNASSGEIYGSASTGADGLAPVLYAGNHASNVLTIYDGIVGVGMLSPSATGNVPTVNQKGGTVEISAGTSVTTIVRTGGYMKRNNPSGANVTQSGGTLETGGVGTLADVNATAGKMILAHRAASGSEITGTLTLDGCDIDLTTNPDTFNIATTVIKRGGTVTLFKADQLDPGTQSFNASYGTTVTLKVAR